MSAHQGNSWPYLFGCKNASQIYKHHVPLLDIFGRSGCLLYSSGTLFCREDERLKRIQDEGYDRYAPISETNRPPNAVPSKRPPVDDDSD